MTSRLFSGALRSSLRSAPSLRGATTSNLLVRSLPLSRRIHFSPRVSSAALTNILEDAPAPPIQVKRMTEDGIELVDGLLLPSSCIFIDGKVYLWEVQDTIKDGKWTTWNKDIFEIFDVVIPKPEILLLGTGPNAVLPPPELRKYLSSIGVQVDIMDTWNACSTYNLLSEEGRRVAAALLQPTRPSWGSSQ